MNSLPVPIIFKITDAGKLAVLSLDNNGLSIKLNTLKYGGGIKTVDGSETDLIDVFGSTSAIVGGIEQLSNTLRFSCAIRSITKKSVHEIGLFDDTGVLFAIASTTDVMFETHPHIVINIAFGMSLDDIDSDNIIISIDPYTGSAAILMNDHLTSPDPHPQYTHVDDHQSLAQSLSNFKTSFNSWKSVFISQYNTFKSYIEGKIEGIESQIEVNVDDIDAIKQGLEDKADSISCFYQFKCGGSVRESGGDNGGTSKTGHYAKLNTVFGRFIPESIGTGYDIVVTIPPNSNAENIDIVFYTLTTDISIFNQNQNEGLVNVTEDIQHQISFEDGTVSITELNAFLSIDFDLIHVTCYA